MFPLSTDKATDFAKLFGLGNVQESAMSCLLLLGKSS